MTEKLNVSEDGRLTVERVEGKQSIDLDLSTVDEVYFEAAPVLDRPGALVLVDLDGEKHVIRVDNEDAGDALAQVRGPIVAGRDARREQARPSDEPAAIDVREDEEPKEAPASTDEGTPTPVQRSRRSRQQS